MLLERMDGCGGDQRRRGGGQGADRRPRPSGRASSSRTASRSAPAFTDVPGGPGVHVPGRACRAMHQGECVGAIGVSGVQSHEDEQVAQAGANGDGR